MGAVEHGTGKRGDNIPGEAKEILRSLASKWEDVLDSNALHMIPLKGAMTNQVFQIKWPTKTGYNSRKVILRIYGDGVEVFFDRHDEIRTFEFMSKHGQGPRLLGRFQNGRIEEFLHARTLSACDLRNPDISAIVAAKMKEFHDLDMPGSRKTVLWDKLRFRTPLSLITKSFATFSSFVLVLHLNYHNLVFEHYRNWVPVAKSVCPPKEATAFRLDAIEEEISILEKEMSRDQLIGFCHNDLQYGNIMMDEVTKAITIIDYEYASYNPIAYDIANHFCEMAADYHTDTPHILNYSKYPDLEERKRFLNMYLRSSGKEAKAIELEKLIQEVEKYTLASHLIWGLWGIISEHVNGIDFDYKEYASQRFEQYWLRKPALLHCPGKG